MPRHSAGKDGSADKSSKSLTIKSGTRFWLTIVDAAYDGPEENAPEPEIIWVEVDSLGRKRDRLAGGEHSVVVKRLMDPYNPERPISGDSRKVTLNMTNTGYDSFLEIKISAEYAQDLLGGIQGTSPYQANAADPSIPEIPTRNHPPEITPA
jgi:hypothetical protein